MNLFNKKGIAVITVVSIVGIGLLMALAYLFGMRYQFWTARAFLASIRAKYAAESIANYATCLINSDSEKGVDSFDDEFFKVFAGSNVDSDGDGVKDSKWIYLDDDLRAAVLIVDETGKANLNCPCQRIDLVCEELIKEGKLSADYRDFYKKVWNFLKGKDGAWGAVGKDDNYDNYILQRNGLDDDIDGEVDELAEGVDDPGEFLYPFVYGDDRFFETIDDINRIFDINDDKYFKTLLKYFTVNALSSDIDITDMPKENLNYLSAVQLVKNLLEVGVDSPWQKAVNIRDFVDKDFSRSQLFAQSLVFKAYSWQEAPSWKRVGDLLVTSTPSDAWEYWQWDGIMPGQYYCYLYAGEDNNYIGDVRVNGVEKLNVYSGDGITFKKVYVDNTGKLKVEIRFPAGSGKDKAFFSHVELVPAVRGLSGNKVITGIEGVRISEVYSHPKLTFLASDAKLLQQGDWQYDGAIFINNNPGGGSSGEGIWEFTGLPNGVYYVQLFGRNDTDIVGDVDVGWTKEKNFRSGQWLSSVVQIYDGTLRVKIQNNQPDGTICYFRGIVLSQEPDVEFVEITNITKQKVDIGGWFLAVDDKQGYPAYIPVGTVINPGESIVLAVDGFDNTTGIAANNIALLKQFPDVDPAKVVSLDLPIQLDNGFDFIPDSGVLYLKNTKAEVVDGVNLSRCRAFYSIYRNVFDNSDENGDGNFDSWSFGKDEDKPTPAQADLEDEDLFVKNSAVNSIAELFSVSDGQGKGLSQDDVAKIWSKLVVCGIDLYPFGHRVYGWAVEQDCLLSRSKGEELCLSWSGQDGVSSGYYHIVLSIGPYEAVEVAFCEEDICEEFSPLLWSDSSGDLDLGWIFVKNDRLKIKIRNASPTGTAHFYGLHMWPNYHWHCRININTASVISLLATGLSYQQASAIVNSRPFGVGDSAGLGDVVRLLPKDVLFFVDKFLSINSDSYTIIATGESLRKGRPEAQQRIWVGVERH